MSEEMAFHPCQMEQKALYFEGWYSWFQCEQATIAVIFAVSKKDPTIEYLIQLYDTLTHQSRITYFANAEFTYEPFSVKMGENQLSEHGLYLHLADLEVNLQFHDLHHLKECLYTPTIMGPLAYMKNLQCVHAIISMRHYVDGWIKVKGVYRTCYGQGYMEKDWGSVFPSSYIWGMGQHYDRSFVLAIANIPVWKTKFQGMFAVVHAGDEEIRFASYYGAYVYHEQLQDVHKISVHQGTRHLYIKIIAGRSGRLKAPDEGGMKAIIEESLTSRILIRVFHHKTLLLEQTFEQAAFEYRQA